MEALKGLGKGSIALLVGVLVLGMVLGACSFSSDGSDKVEIVRAQEETNQAMIHQAGVNAGVNAIMGNGGK